MKHRSKHELPTKVCMVCKRPFSWRKKWERDWEHVKYCSDQCRRNGKLSETLSNTSRNNK
ncbi:MAG: DUF2256 domain-containing protein [Pirellula sp.]|nr:DUF2256 domain-containing protein [Planctomycetota bacterium]